MTAVGSHGSTFFFFLEGRGGVLPNPFFLEAWLVCVTGQGKFK